MIVPVDCQIDKTQYIANKIGSHAKENRPIGTVRHFQFENHDSDNRDDAVTECGQTNEVDPGFGTSGLIGAKAASS